MVMVADMAVAIVRAKAVAIVGAKAVAIVRAKAVAARVASSVVSTVRCSPFGVCTATSLLHWGQFVTPTFPKERKHVGDKGRGKGNVCVCVRTHAR